MLPDLTIEISDLQEAARRIHEQCRVLPPSPASPIRGATGMIVDDPLAPTEAEQLESLDRALAMGALSLDLYSRARKELNSSAEPG